MVNAHVTQIVSCSPHNASCAGLSMQDALNVMSWHVQDVILIGHKVRMVSANVRSLMLLIHSTQQNVSYLTRQ